MTDTTKTRLLVSQRTDYGNADTFKNENTPVEYCDGIAQITVGPGVARLDLFVTRDAIQEEGLGLVDKRDVSRTIVLPTIVFIDFIVNALEGAIANKSLVSTSMEHVLAGLEQKIAQLKQDSTH